MQLHLPPAAGGGGCRCGGARTRRSHNAPSTPPRLAWLGSKAARDDRACGGEGKVSAGPTCRANGGLGVLCRVEMASSNRSPTAHSRETPLTACVSSRLLAPMSITRGAGREMSVEEVALQVGLIGEIPGPSKVSAPRPQHAACIPATASPISPGQHQLAHKSPISNFGPIVALQVSSRLPQHGY